MNLVLDDAEEVYFEKSGKETKARQDLGKWLVSLGGGRRRAEGRCWWGWGRCDYGRCGKQDDRSGSEGNGARVQWGLSTGMIWERNAMIWDRKADK